MKKTLMTSALALGLAFGAAPSFAETYFPIIAKGFSHQFWQAVKQGAEKAATDLRAERDDSPFDLEFRLLTADGRVVRHGSDWHRAPQNRSRASVPQASAIDWSVRAASQLA